ATRSGTDMTPIGLETHELRIAESSVRRCIARSTKYRRREGSGGLPVGTERVCAGDGETVLHAHQHRTDDAGLTHDLRDYPLILVRHATSSRQASARNAA